MQDFFNMNIFKKIKNYISNIISEYKLYNEDKRNRKSFIATVKSELENRGSFFSLYNIRVDRDNYEQVNYLISIPPEFQIAGQDWQIKDKLDENSYIVSRYLKNELGFGNNINGPEYYHLEDPADDNVSTQYLSVWSFTNQIQSKKRIYIINSILSIIGISLISLLLYMFIF